jgi:carboxymethylenebutenolidase
VAPDTFRGASSTFIPKCIWLAVSTPQDRVNQDLDDVFAHYSNMNTGTNVAVMGFCYGGGKAIRYTTQCRPTATTVVCYGSPVTDVESLARLEKPVCGIFGRDDMQFPMSLVEQFDAALEEAGVENSDVTVYDGVGHAFWSDMDEIKQKEQPQYDAYQRVVDFLKRNFDKPASVS